MTDVMRVGVLGAGGLGKAAARIIGMKRELKLVAICDSRGFAFDEDGLNCQAIATLEGDLVEGYRQAAASSAAQNTGSGGVMTATRTVVRHASDPINEIIGRSPSLDGILVALPNLPNEFIPGIARRFFDKTHGLLFVDALKRTRAAELMFQLVVAAKRAAAVYLVGCGATPGLLSAAAVLAAQSFTEVESVDIHWGVGIANWEAYKATIREDIAHLPGYTVERARAMSDAEVEALLDQTDGKLELRNMEHADDVLLQRVGVVERQEQVTVGGVMDTRHARKPVSTTMTLTGKTFDGRRSSHKFVLGDETTMAANVIGPALGYLKRAAWLKAHGIYGVFGSTEFMPLVVR